MSDPTRTISLPRELLLRIIDQLHATQQRATLAKLLVLSHGMYDFIAPKLYDRLDINRHNADAIFAGLPMTYGKEYDSRRVTKRQYRKTHNRIYQKAISSLSLDSPPSGSYLTPAEGLWPAHPLFPDEECDSDPEYAYHNKPDSDDENDPYRPRSLSDNSAAFEQLVEVYANIEKQWTTFPSPDTSLPHNGAGCTRKVALLQLVKHLTVTSVPFQSTSLNLLLAAPLQLFRGITHIVLPHRVTAVLTTWYDLMRTLHHPFARALQMAVNPTHVCITSVPDDDTDSDPYTAVRYQLDPGALTPSEAMARLDVFDSRWQARETRLREMIGMFEAGWTRVEVVTLHGLLRVQEATFGTAKKTRICYSGIYFPYTPDEVMDRAVGILEFAKSFEHVRVVEVLHVGRNVCLRVNAESEPRGDEREMEAAIKRLVFTDDGMQSLHLGIPEVPKSVLDRIRILPWDEAGVEPCECCGTMGGSTEDWVEK